MKKSLFYAVVAFLASACFGSAQVHTWREDFTTSRIPMELGGLVRGKDAGASIISGKLVMDTGIPVAGAYSYVVSVRGDKGLKGPFGTLKSFDPFTQTFTIKLKIAKLEGEPKEMARNVFFVAFANDKASDFRPAAKSIDSGYGIMFENSQEGWFVSRYYANETGNSTETIGALDSAPSGLTFTIGPKGTFIEVEDAQFVRIGRAGIGYPGDAKVGVSTGELPVLEPAVLSFGVFNHGNVSTNTVVEIDSVETSIKR